MTMNALVLKGQLKLFHNKATCFPAKDFEAILLQNGGLF